MARRAYNGILTHIVRDITGRDEYYVLINAGKDWHCLAKREAAMSLSESTNTMEEKDVYRQWYDIFLLEEELYD